MSDSAPRRIVVDYDPRRRLKRRLFFAVSVLLALVLGLWMGDARILQHWQAQQHLAEQRDGWQQRAVEAEGRVSALIMELELERQASELLRRDTAELQAQAVSLREEIGFYQSLMTPGEQQQGLSIRSMEFVATEGPRRYRYRLVLQQLGGNHPVMSGRVRFQISGRAEGQLRQLDWSQLLPETETAGHPFHLRYFQNLDGYITLPTGFFPETVLVTLSPAGNNVTTIERQLAWRLRQGA